MIFLELLLFSLSFASEKTATLEFQLANLSQAASEIGELRIEIGKNCRRDGSNICDYRTGISTEIDLIPKSFYKKSLLWGNSEKRDEGFVKFANLKHGLNANRGNFTELKTPVEINNDVIELTYTFTDRLIFKGIRLRLETGVNKQTEIVELFNARQGNGFADSRLSKIKLANEKVEFIEKQTKKCFSFWSFLMDGEPTGLRILFNLSSLIWKIKPFMLTDFFCQ